MVWFVLTVNLQIVDSLEFFLMAESLCQDDSLTSQQIKDAIRRSALNSAPSNLHVRRSNPGFLNIVQTMEPANDIVTNGHHHFLRTPIVSEYQQTSGTSVFD